jgi:hypothetical protein
MEQQGIPQQKRKINPWTVMMAVALVAILVLGVLVFIFKAQADDYKASKYRAQIVLVIDIVDSLPIASAAIDEMCDDTLDNGWRRSAAKYAQATVEGISADCEAVSVMYLIDQDRRLAFENLSIAMTALADTVEQGYAELSTADIPQGDRDLSAPIDQSLANSTLLLDDIELLVVQGLDPGVDWEESPYQPVEDMDLDAIEVAAQELLDAQP